MASGRACPMEDRSPVTGSKEPILSPVPPAAGAEGVVAAGVEGAGVVVAVLVAVGVGLFCPVVLLGELQPALRKPVANVVIARAIACFDLTFLLASDNFICFLHSSTVH